MKIHNVKQGSAEWLRLRCGIPTASNFSKIVTPTGKLSAQADAYMHALIAERIINDGLDDGSSSWMQRGSAIEHEAFSAYSFVRGLKTTRVGFVTTDDFKIGCSPDFFVMNPDGWGFKTDDSVAVGGGEIKCPNPAAHVGYLLDDLPEKFKPQVQGCLYVTGLDWWDVMSYCPGFPPAGPVRASRDPEFQDKLSNALDEFCDRLEERYEHILKTYEVQTDWRRLAA